MKSHNILVVLTYWGRLMFMRMSILILAIVLLIGCKSNTTDTYSSQFKTSNERIAFLKKYVKLCSSVADTEFHIQYQDDSEYTFVPSTSEWHMKVVMKISKKDIAKWRKGFVEEKKMVNLDFGHNLIKGNPRWSLKSKAKIYRNETGTILAIFEKEGVIFKEIESF